MIRIEKETDQDQGRREEREVAGEDLERTWRGPWEERMAMERGKERRFRWGWMLVVWGLLGTIGFSQEFVTPTSGPVGAAEAAPKRGGAAHRADYRVGPGDVLLIEVAGEPELKRKVKVMERGTIRLPYIPRDLLIAGHV